MADLDDTISDAALQPAEAENDSSRVKQQPLPDLIAADQYLKGNAALSGGKSAWGATRPARLVPPGTGADGATEATPDTINP
jgi:hypothetical protein